MKNLKAKLQSLRQRAEQLQQVVESAPARAERLRGAVHTAAGQFQQLRSEVQGTVSALRMNDDSQMAAALVEIGESESVFLAAGYHLTGVDMEPGMAPRLLVRLEKLDEVRESVLVRLQNENRTRPTIYALLSAMQKAEATAASVELPGLEYSRLTVHVGPIPSIQIGWRRTDEPEPERPAVLVSAPVMAQPAPPPLPGSSSPASFFAPAEPELPAPAPSRPASPVTTTVPVEPVRSRPSPTPQRFSPLVLSSSPKPSSSSPGSTGDWRKDALAKFKQMPAPKG